MIEIPEDLNIVATYPVAVLKDAERPELAGEWVELVTGEKGQRVLPRTPLLSTPVNKGV